MPHKTSVVIPWRMKKSRYNLAGTECCGIVSFPPKNICENCGSKDMKEKIFSGDGTIVSYTTINTPPTGFKGPYNVAIIKLDEGPMISGIVIGRPSIGKKVKKIFRKIFEDGDSGIIHYGFKFEIID